MVSSDDDDRARERFEELSGDLNMDTDTSDEAWASYKRISTNYTLEGDQLHWLACSLYVSCRKSIVPTVTGGHIEGNCVSLTRLLRSAKLSLIEFFKKMRKWADMASLPQEFRDKVERLERNFAVSTVTFKKFEPIFFDVFANPADDPPRPPKSRKQRKLPCTATDLFNFCWTTFVQVKGHYPAISDDLVNSYHLLLCCIDWLFGNTLISNRVDLVNCNFSGLPKNFNQHDYRVPAELPCIVRLLCEKYEGLQMEAKEIKEHWFKLYIRNLFDKKTLKGRADNLTGVIDIGNFDDNSKSISSKYEAYVLDVGDFDERIFLGDSASMEIGTPAKGALVTADESSERQIIGRNLWQNYHDSSVFTPLTPLTGRRYLREKEGLVTPVSTATQSVSRLQILLSGCKPAPSDSLLTMFSQCTRNPHDSITERVVEMGNVFCAKFSQPSSDHQIAVADFAQRRLQLAETLYFKVLEKILVNERQRKGAGTENKNIDFSILFEQDIFHRSLFAICLEIVLFSYNSQRVFPWTIEIFEISSYYFYKVIEVLIRVEDGLSRDVVKHLNHIEECILESLAWRSDSPLWEAMAQADVTVPSVEEASLPSQLEREPLAGLTTPVAVPISAPPTQFMTSPPVHPSIRRVTATSLPITLSLKRDSPVTVNVPPPSSPSAADRFSSPIHPSQAKRRLFDTASAVTSASSAAMPGAGGGSSSSVPSIPMALITDKSGRQILIPVQVSTPSASPIKRRLPESGDSSAVIQAITKPVNCLSTNKPKRTGSLALFFRKVYHLASVRMRELCDKLDIDAELCSQMWTCFEHCLMKHIELFKDRHIDQIVMCSIYVLAKVTNKDRSFQDIMKCYRIQPQAQSHIYRSVLLGTSQPQASATEERRGRRDRSSGGSRSAAAADSGLNTIRSSSTLPMPEPSSEPPTPTRMAGAGNTFQFDDRGEDRGDLIKFYNTIFVIRIKDFAMKFSALNTSADKPLLSPLPVKRTNPMTSPRKVSHNHSVYVSPHKTAPGLMTPHTRLLYCFNRSPARDLRAINNMLQNSNEGTMIKKRLPLIDEGASESPAKRVRMSASPGGLHKRLEEVINERNATTNGNN